MSITRLPWADKPKHDYGVWYRIQTPDGYFIGTARGKHNAQLLQNAPKVLHHLECCMKHLEAAAGDESAQDLLLACKDLVHFIRNP
jgi:hypothetical protein